MKSKVFLSGINGSKWVVKTLKMMKDVVVQNLTELVNISAEPIHSNRRLSVRAMDMQLYLDKGTVKKS